MLPHWSRPFHVTAASGRQSRTSRSTPVITPREITRQQGIPVTTPAATALDIAVTFPPNVLPRHQPRAPQGLPPRAALNEIVERSANKPGVSNLATRH